MFWFFGIPVSINETGSEIGKYNLAHNLLRNYYVPVTSHKKPKTQNNKLAIAIAVWRRRCGGDGSQIG